MRVGQSHTSGLDAGAHKHDRVARAWSERGHAFMLFACLDMATHAVRCQDATHTARILVRGSATARPAPYEMRSA